MATREEDFVSRIFIASTHTPVLFFSSRGIVYKLKVYQVPLGTPQARGKALVNLLPLQAEETITTTMPMPEDEETWGDMYVMFATTNGTVRRNRLSDFTRIQANGKIAMKLDEEGSRLVNVQTCGEDDDVLLASAKGKCIRFRVPDVRVFSGRNSVGVRGIRLAKGDQVISMTILRHRDLSVEERDAYLRLAGARRRGENGENGEESEPCAPEEVGVEIDEARFAVLEAAEQFLLSIADDGQGKRTSAYEYRVIGRGGQGLANMDLTRGKKKLEVRVVAAFPVASTDELVLVTDGGQLIRCPVGGIRIAGRSTRGVRVFDVDEDERVVSVARLADVDPEVDAEEDDLEEFEAEEDGSEELGAERDDPEEPEAEGDDPAGPDAGDSGGEAEAAPPAGVDPEESA
jgi:DNA gyrase subunit A